MKNWIKAAFTVAAIVILVLFGFVLLSKVPAEVFITLLIGGGTFCAVYTVKQLYDEGL